MEEFWGLILVAFVATNTLDKVESAQLEELPLETFDEIFGEGWWDNDKAEEWHKLTLEQDLHQIDLQNAQLRQIETNSTDQNPPLTESDHSDQIKDERKRKIVDKFHAIKEEFKRKGKYSANKWNQIQEKIAKHLKVSRKKIYKWKKEFGISRKVFNKKEERKNLIENFDQRKVELKRAGFKNSYPYQIDKTVAKELGISYRTISNWKRKLGQTKPQHNHNEQKELMKCYYEIKDKNSKISDADIAKMLKIGTTSLYTWKKQFKRQQFHANSVVSVEVNAAANVQEIGHSNSGVFE